MSTSHAWDRFTQGFGMGAAKELYCWAFCNRPNLVTRKATRATGQIAKTTTYGYNYQNQPTTVQVNGTAIAQYGYDVSKQRIYKKTTSTGEERVYNWDAAGHIITEGPKANPYEIRYIYLGNEKLAMVRNGEVYYFINTMTGTPDRIMDKTGKIVQKIQLDEWGRVEKVKGPFRDEINFTGKKLDKETGLYYFNQRYYDPELGRFIQEDPAGQGLNAYAYCGNNPCVYVDPDGQWFFVAIAMYFGAEAGGAVLAAAVIADAMVEVASVSAAFNAGEQLLLTGRVNWGQVGQAGFTGAVMGGLSEGIGSAEFGSSAMANIMEDGVNYGVSTVIASSIRGESMSTSHAWDRFTQGFGMGAAMGAAKELHYLRNERNVSLPKTLDEADAAGGVDVKADYHQLRGSSGNVKRVFSDGREAIYDSMDHLVTNSLNGGTYNYINPGSFIRNVGHAWVDVVPYYLFKNSRQDPSFMYERISGYSIGY